MKLKHYGVSDTALNLLVSYISDRKQCVKVGQYTSTFQNILKGSILKPVLFNVFLNDIFGVVKHSTLYNYAEDNSVSHAHHDVTVLKTSLETDSKSLINWFHLNKNESKS